MTDSLSYVVSCWSDVLRCYKSSQMIRAYQLVGTRDSVFTSLRGWRSWAGSGTRRPLAWPGSLARIPPPLFQPCRHIWSWISTFEWACPLGLKFEGQRWAVCARTCMLWQFTHDMYMYSTDSVMYEWNMWHYLWPHIIYHSTHFFNKRKRLLGWVNLMDGEPWLWVREYTEWTESREANFSTAQWQ